MSIRSRRALSFGLWGLFTLGTLTSSTLSVAQESTLADARARTKAAPLDAAASMTYGRALLRAGHDTEALTEFRRGVGVLGTSTTKASLLARFEWELARTHIERREFQQALGICRAIAKLPSETAVSHVCIAEAHLLWRRGTEALTELSALSNEQKPGKDVPVDVQYAAKVAEGRSFELASNDTGAESSYRDAMKMDLHASTRRSDSGRSSSGSGRTERGAPERRGD